MIFNLLAIFIGAASAGQLEAGMKAIQSQTGCYLVDYSYTEVEALKAGYTLDERVYDVNKDKSVKEWIFAENLSANSVRLQHILFSTDLNGKPIEGSFLKHQAEDWQFNANYLYDFVKPSTWDVKTIAPGLWTRKVTNLDDGLRYQCASSWLENNAYLEWSCSNYAPIPGRETRDMGRKDYNTLDRSTRIIAYGSSWLERQDNIKSIYKDDQKIALARELGKNWYVRLPDSECDSAKQFANARMKFWTLLRETWDLVLDGRSGFVEKPVPGKAPRFTRMMELESQVTMLDLDQPMIRAQVQNKILEIIGEYRQ